MVVVLNNAADFHAGQIKHHATDFQVGGLLLREILRLHIQRNNGSVRMNGSTLNCRDACEAFALRVFERYRRQFLRGLFQNFDPRVNALVSNHVFGLFFVIEINRRGIRIFRICSHLQLVLRRRLELRKSLSCETEDKSNQTNRIRLTHEVSPHLPTPASIFLGNAIVAYQTAVCTTPVWGMTLTRIGLLHFGRGGSL